MTARRLAPIATALLIASLAGCNPSAAKTDSDSKPSAPASQPGKASAAPGAPAGGNDLSLAEAIAKIPAGAEDRTGYERDSFRLWVD
ncbi:HNH endonuclease, partial [Streptomyces sp. NPDC015680]